MKKKTKTAVAPQKEYKHPTQAEMDKWIVESCAKKGFRIVMDNPQAAPTKATGKGWNEQDTYTPEGSTKTYKL